MDLTMCMMFLAVSDRLFQTTSEQKTAIHFCNKLRCILQTLHSYPALFRDKVQVFLLLHDFSTLLHQYFTVHVCHTWIPHAHFQIMWVRGSPKCAQCVFRNTEEPIFTFWKSTHVCIKANYTVFFWQRTDCGYQIELHKQLSSNSINNQKVAGLLQTPLRSV